jgi:hypothetical protein
VDLSAHGSNVGLVEEEPRGMAPAIAVLGPIRREGQPVVGCIANRAQDRPPLVGRGSVSFWERYAAGNDMPRIFG